MVSLIDTHSHIQFPEFDETREGILKRMHEMHVGTIVVGCDKKSSEDGVRLSQGHAAIWAVVGVHPTTESEGFDASEYSALLSDKKVVGIGECGMDFFRIDLSDTKEISRQEKVFRAQIEAAITYKKALMLHVRPSKNSVDAHLQVLSILNEYKESALLQGTSHFFTATPEIAKKYLDIGFTVSMPGVVTFAKELAEVVEYVPLDMMLLESDAPYATPVPHRGTQNEPAFVSFTAQKIADIKKMSLDEVARVTTTNATRVFDLVI